MSRCGCGCGKSGVHRGADFEIGRQHRYLLWRAWDMSLPSLNVIGLNPSTADESIDDPTIRRCIGFARAWGYGALEMTNLFAWRATDPAELKRPQLAVHVIGQNNDRRLLDVATAHACGMVLAAWGVHGTYLGRDQQVLDKLRGAGVRVHCLGVTKDGHPRHPLYLPKTATPILFEPERELAHA